MSNLDQRPEEAVCGAQAAGEPVRELLPATDVVVGPRGLAVSRTLPGRARRMVGAWCFLDHYGPAPVGGSDGMRVPPHPHTGIQTVSWLVSGDVLHTDSLGSEQLIRPGQLNLMTAGRAIAHAEQTPPVPAPVLHGVQLWVALPGPDRDIAPEFGHHPGLPVVTDGGAEITVIMGALGDVTSPARTFSPLIGAQIRLSPGADVDLPLRPGFEYAVLALTGSAAVDGEPLAAGPLLYLGTGRSGLSLSAAGDALVLLIGGEPFAEEIVMWWNFVGRTHDDIVRDRTDWMSGERFGTVHSYPGPPLPAPPMPKTRLKPRGRVPHRPGEAR
jgi:redox-sensitive bicupin YhaK (pirin superfamily)